MTDKRKKDGNWIVTNVNGVVTEWGQVHTAVLMDLRDELKGIRQHLSSLEMLARCVNVQRGVIAMNRLRLHIERHGAKPKPKRK